MAKETNEQTPGAFATPTDFMAIPRLQSLVCSADSSRLVASVQEIDEEGAKFVTSLWELDTSGAKARRLTRSKEGESSAAFLPDNSLLFVSSRPRPSEKGNDDGEGALYLLPHGGGEAVLLATKPGGVTGVVAARASRRIVVLAMTSPSSEGPEDDEKWWADRRSKKVSAALFESLPVRHWDHYLGPAEVHLYSADADELIAGEGELVDLTPNAGVALHDSSAALAPDGATVVVDWLVPTTGGGVRSDLVAIDTFSGERRTLASSADEIYDFSSPRISPDGRKVVVLRSSHSSITDPPRVDAYVVDLADGSGKVVSLDDGPTITGADFGGDGASLLVGADERGRAPVYRVDLLTGEARRLTSDGAWTSLTPLAGGSELAAVRSDIGEPPRPVIARLERDGGLAEALTAIDCPGELRSIPGRVEEVEAKAADGTPIRGWLVVPEGASAKAPAPFALMIHGGPLGSWNSWHWRWNPWLLAARGWAVLLPDPALSTGYGEKMLRRGWGRWGGAPYDDLMAITDAAISRPEIDSSRTAAIGGSYGGYMANWIAGHTDRFSAIVSHASLWSLEHFQGTTDWPAYWAEEWGYPDSNPELYEQWSPHRYASKIVTPMLIIHGEKDYRCPVGESLGLWSELVRRGVDARFLWFENENHWILKPGDAVVWYEAVLGFLEEKVLGGSFERPRLS